jgi:uncharacterized membrane protein YfcA
VRLVLIGLLAGFLSALFGVGGGLVAVPLLILLCRYGPHAATATSLAAIVLTALAGTVTYAFHGELDLGYAALVGIPAALGATLGTMVQQRVRARALTYLFALFLVGVAVSLLV